MSRFTARRALLAAVSAFALAVFVLPSLADAKPAGKGDSKKAPPAAKGAPPGVTVNACGCYRTEAGACFCGDKKAKCECPGECEPIGCEAKRSKDVDREIAAETKKAQDEEKKRHAAEAAAQAAREAPPPAEDTAAGDDAEPAKDDKDDKAETKKPRRKPAAKESQAKNK
jgi:hypothetical protein